MKKFLTLLTGTALIFSVQAFSQLAVHANNSVVTIVLGLPKNSNFDRIRENSTNSSKVRFICTIKSRYPNGIYGNAPISAIWNGSSPLPTFFDLYHPDTKVNIKGLDPGEYLLKWEIFCLAGDTDDLYEQYLHTETYIIPFIVSPS